MTMLPSSFASLLRAALLLMFFAASAADTTENTHYIIIGVSGGLQPGFPAHKRLHYDKGLGEHSKALFLGKGLVRGYKAFLDLMEEGWREYDAQEPVMNSNVFASGCYEHANEYWLYFVDARHAMSVLNHEPRFLSLTPDTGSIELEAAETDPVVQEFFHSHLSAKHFSALKLTNVAIPLVTAVYFNPTSHLPSPPISVHDDGTLVTNFPDSLAAWANVHDSDRTAMADTTVECKDKQCPPSAWVDAVKAEQRYWNGIRQAIRKAEKNRPTLELAKQYGPPFQCQKKVRFGVDDVTSTRVNYPLTARDIASTLNDIGYHPDFDTGEVRVGVPKDEAVAAPDL